jgi:hypothetical protein
MSFGNVAIRGMAVRKEDNGYDIKAEYLPDDKDFKKTRKVCWLPDKEDLIVRFY